MVIVVVFRIGLVRLVVVRLLCCIQVKADAVRREEERAKRLQEEADRKAELQKVRF